MLKVSGLTKSFGKVVILNDLSFEVKEGEFVFITGPSGSGKTTLMRLILRELLPNKGGIFLDDVDVTKIPKKQVPNLRQHIGTVFQDYKILPERTVRENIDVAMAVVGIPSDEWDGRSRQVLKLTGIEDKIDMFPSQLAGGELQRVAMARALVINPKIILADEPTGNLDWDTADKIMDLFEKINKEGKTILMATHHQGIVDKMNKRVIGLVSNKVEKKPAVVKSTDEKIKKETETAKPKKDEDSKRVVDKKEEKKEVKKKEEKDK